MIQGERSAGRYAAERAGACDLRGVETGLASRHFVSLADLQPAPCATVLARDEGEMASARAPTALEAVHARLAELGDRASALAELLALTRERAFGSPPGEAAAGNPNAPPNGAIPALHRMLDRAEGHLATALDHARVLRTIA